MKIVIEPTVGETVGAQTVPASPGKGPSLTVQPVFYSGRLRSNVAFVKSFDDAGVLKSTALVQVSGKDGSLHLLDITSPVVADVDTPAQDKAADKPGK